MLAFWQKSEKYFAVKLPKIFENFKILPKKV